jgi:hypothetical protein
MAHVNHPWGRFLLRGRGGARCTSAHENESRYQKMRTHTELTLLSWTCPPNDSAHQLRAWFRVDTAVADRLTVLPDHSYQRLPYHTPAPPQVHAPVRRHSVHVIDLRAPCNDPRTSLQLCGRIMVLRPQEVRVARAPSAALLIVVLGIAAHYQSRVLADYETVVRPSPVPRWYAPHPPSSGELGLAQHLVQTGDFRSSVSKPFEIVAIHWQTCQECQDLESRVRFAWCSTQRWSRSASWRGSTTAVRDTSLARGAGITDISSSPISGLCRLTTLRITCGRPNRHGIRQPCVQ